MQQDVEFAPTARHSPSTRALPELLRGAENMEVSNIVVMRTSTLFLGLILLVWGGSGCGDASAPTSLTPETEQDAAFAAVLLGQTLRPDPELASTLAGDLSAIREGYGDEVPAVLALHVRPPWRTDRILLRFTSEGMEKVVAGTYTAWDALNREQGGMVGEVNPSLREVWLHFDGVFHPREMAQLYSGLPDLEVAKPDRLLGDGANLYPLVREGTRGFLFREAWGDCLSGCSENEFWYFECDAGGPRYLGPWNGRDEPRPEWADLVWSTVFAFHEW